eukprot:scaffold198872_cov18-Tisochrysis_lutea.AAC.1
MQPSTNKAQEYNLSISLALMSKKRNGYGLPAGKECRYKRTQAAKAHPESGEPFCQVHHSDTSLVPLLSSAAYARNYRRRKCCRRRRQGWQLDTNGAACAISQSKRSKQFLSVMILSISSASWRGI